MQFLIAVLFAAALATGAQAQTQSDNRGADHLDFISIYNAGIFKESLAAVGKPDLLATPEEISQATLDSLNFTPSSEVERATRQKLLASLLDTTKKAPVQAQIKLTVRSDDLWHQFNGVLQKAGLSSTNLADVTAATYLIAWEVVNSNNAAAGAKAIRAVRDSVAASLTADGHAASMSDAEKQQAASVMAYLATVAADSVNELQRTGDEVGLAKLREHVHATVMAQGIDLDRLLLTDNGFVAR